MIRSCLCYYSDEYLHIKGNIAIPNTGTATASNNADNKVIFKNCVPFTHADYANDILYNEYYQAVGAANNVIDFPADKNSNILFKFK